MAGAYVLAFVLQQLAVSPYPCEAGQEVVVRAADGSAALAGLALQLELEDGGALPIGATDASGELRFVAATSGLHRIAGVRNGVRLVAPVRVVPVPPRWLYALVCVPLGIALLIRSLRSSPVPPTTG